MAYFYLIGIGVAIAVTVAFYWHDWRPSVWAWIALIFLSAGAIRYVEPIVTDALEDKRCEIGPVGRAQYAELQDKAAAYYRAFRREQGWNPNRDSGRAGELLSVALLDFVQTDADAMTQMAEAHALMRAFGGRLIDFGHYRKLEKEDKYLGLRYAFYGGNYPVGNWSQPVTHLFDPDGYWWYNLKIGKDGLDQDAMMPRINAFNSWFKRYVKETSSIGCPQAAWLADLAAEK